MRADITISCERGVRPEFGLKRRLRRCIKTVMKAEHIEENVHVDVLLTDDEGIRVINREYRNIDSATDVLSFAMNELMPGRFESEKCVKNPENGQILLGDMVISVERCRAQAEEFGNGFDREICYLTVHSALHLLGYDHVDEDVMKRQMRRREEYIMRMLGLSKLEK